MRALGVALVTLLAASACTLDSVSEGVRSARTGFENLTGRLATPGLAPGQDRSAVALRNMQALIQACFRPGTPQQRVAQLRRLGFGERVQTSRLTGEVTYSYFAPGGTAQAKLFVGENVSYCTVSSEDVGVTAASKLLDGYIPRIYPRYVRSVQRGPANASTGVGAACVAYKQPGVPMLNSYTVVNPGDRARCVDDGTSLIDEFVGI